MVSDASDEARKPNLRQPKMQCVLVRGLLRNFRLVVFANVDTKITKDLLDTIILACERAGARIVACVSDMAPGMAIQ